MPEHSTRGFEVFVGRITAGKLYVGVSWQVIDRIDASHSLLHFIKIQQITMDELETWIFPEGFDVFLFTAGEIVKHQDFAPARQKRGDEIRADATCSSCNEDPLIHDTKLAKNQV